MISWILSFMFILFCKTRLKTEILFLCNRIKKNTFIIQIKKYFYVVLACLLTCIYMLVKIYQTVNYKNLVKNTFAGLI